MPEFLPGPNRPPGNMGIKPGKGFLYRLRDKILGKLMISKFDEFKPLLNEKLVSLSLPALTHTKDLFDRADLRLIQTLESFDIPIEPRPSNVRYIGPELGDPDWTSEEKWQNPWSDQPKKPIVVISFSTTFQNQANAIQNSINALSELPVNGCVTLGPAMEDQHFSTPENVVVLRSVKHSLLFPHVDLVITHGGHGTLMRALSNGLPILCLPMGRDQDDNALKVEVSGCGLKLSPKSGSLKIKKAVKQILENPKFSKNALEMSESINGVETIDKVLIEIDGLLAKNQLITTKAE
ncbi:MAG: hypothetical protein HKN16_05130 [Saprospiraceae bacterium]|nr:hypothetical protein [Saprospiraceae bacterium]